MNRFLVRCSLKICFLNYFSGPDLIALLQSGGLLQPACQTPKDSFFEISSKDTSSLPALPNTAISVEDLERNLVSEPKPLQQQLIPPPGFANVQESSPSLDPLKALEIQMLQNQSLMRGQVEPLLGEQGLNFLKS